MAYFQIIHGKDKHNGAKVVAYEAAMVSKPNSKDNANKSSATSVFRTLHRTCS